MKPLNQHTFSRYDAATQDRIWRAVRMLRDRISPDLYPNSCTTGILAPERYCAQYRVAGWSRDVSMADVPGIMRLETRGQFSTAVHARAAIAWLGVARDAGIAWRAEVRRAREAHGDYGSLISGVYRDHFPPEVKDELRTLCRLETFAADASVAHWIGGAGRRIETWRRERDRVHHG